MLAPAWKRTSFKVLMGSNNARLMALFHQQQLGLYADQSETKALHRRPADGVARLAAGEAAGVGAGSNIPRLDEVQFAFRMERKRNPGFPARRQGRSRN